MKILLVEDEDRLARTVARGLHEEGHRVDVCRQGADAIAQGLQITYDAAVLDWTLPDLDGLTVLRTWRDHGLRLPVLMLTARDTVPERVLGLRSGADDYLTKPFDFGELLARLEALHRRAAGGSRLQVGDVTLDAQRRALVRGEQASPLTSREYGLALALFERAGELLTRAELLATVWGPGFDGEPNVVDVYVGYLRKKLDDLAAGTRIRTIRGAGFRLEPGQGRGAP